MSQEETNMIQLIDAELLVEEKLDERYVNSPFKHLKNIPAKQKGSRFEKIVSNVLTKVGHTIQGPENSEHDRIINGVKTEIKGATLVKKKNHFSFLQIRPEQDYQIMIFAMFYPNELVLMKMEKEQITKNVELGIFKKQHGGKKADSGQFCYYGNRETLLNIGATFVK